MMTIRSPGVLASVLLLSALSFPASAIELSLEENRIQRGSVGFVDMTRVFQLFPDTQGAKQAFDDAVRQAEDQVNLRKAELMRLRLDINKLKVERDALTASARSVAPSSAPAAGEPVVMPSPAPAAAEPAASAPSLSTAPAQPAPLAPEALALAQTEERLQGKTTELARKEAEFQVFQGAAEKNLLDLESRKTQVLLAKIQRGLRDVARKEGISIVVDKSGILYGNEVVDLTDKVLQALKGGSQEAP